MLERKCIILDRLGKTKPTITERLNNLLDINYFHNIEYFEMPENPEIFNLIIINKNFGILNIIEEDKLN